MDLARVANQEFQQPEFGRSGGHLFALDEQRHGAGIHFHFVKF